MGTFHNVNKFSLDSHVRDHLHDNFFVAMGETMDILWEARGYLDTKLAPSEIRDDFMANSNTNNIDGIPCSDLHIMRLRGNNDCSGALYLVSARYSHQHKGFISEMSEMDAFRLAGVNPYRDSNSQMVAHSSLYTTNWLQPKGDLATPSFDTAGLPNGEIKVFQPTEGLRDLTLEEALLSRKIVPGVEPANTVVMTLPTIYDEASGPLDVSLITAAGKLNAAINNDFITGAAIGTLKYHGLQLQYIGGTYYKLLYTAEYSPGGWKEQRAVELDGDGFVQTSPATGGGFKATPITSYIHPLIAPPTIPLHTPKVLIT